MRRNRLQQLSCQSSIVPELSEIRSQIWRIKMNLWNWNVSFEDNSDEDKFVDKQDIEKQQELIANHIKSLYGNEEEMAIYGGAMAVPFNIYRDILIARQVIGYTYARMQKWGVKNANSSDAYSFVDSSLPMWIPSAMAELSLNISNAVLGLRSVRVFLCHSSKDKLAVRNLYDRLWIGGFQPWLDEKDITAGKDWDNEIMKAVQASDVVLVCLSQASITKAGYVQKEIKVALDVADMQPENTIFIIPVKLEECAVPARLSKYQWVNLHEEYGYERLIRALRARGDTSS
jgi:TIR domain